MRINNNIMAMNTYRQLTIGNTNSSKSMEKLSSGYRINRAGDDAAGLAISEKMRGQIRGLSQASRNAQDGISLVQTAEGALQETQAILQRMRELAVQSANDTNASEDREAIQSEIDQLTSEIDRIASTTEFNTKKLLDGSSGLSVGDGSIVGSVNVGTNTQQGTYTVDATSATLATTAKSADVAGTTAATTVNSAGTLTVNGVDVTIEATDTLQDLADKINTNVSGVVADFSGAGSTFKISSSDVGAGASVTVQTNAANVLTAASDWSTAATTNGTNASGLTAGNFDGALGGAALIYDGNKITVSGGDADGLTFNLKDNSADTSVTVNGSVTLQIGANEGQSMTTTINAMDTSALNVSNVDITTATGATDAITTINDAITAVSDERAKLGAVQNRLEHSIKNLDTSAENLQAAESRVRDVDMAKEMMQFTKNNILTQAATAMLAQANQAPQGVLQLLR